MTAAPSNWIPRRRIHVAVALGVTTALVAAGAMRWSNSAALLLIPAAAALWVAFVMLRIRRQLSPAGGDWQARIHAAVLARLDLSRDAHGSVLDIGCGDAALLAALLARAPALDATGVDFWGNAWDYRQARCEARLDEQQRHAQFRQMDAAALDFPDGHFDIIVSVMCFHEVRTPDGAAQRGPLVALAEALRVLRPGGRFVFVDRFGAGDFGGPAALAAVLEPVTDIDRESLVAMLGVPWPLNGQRALGPVDMISGRKRAAPVLGDRRT